MSLAEYPPEWDEVDQCNSCGCGIEEGGYQNRGKLICDGCAQEALRNGDEWIERQVNQSMAGMIKELEAVV